MTTNPKSKERLQKEKVLAFELVKYANNLKSIKKTSPIVFEVIMKIVNEEVR